jgi:hypothetical protein
MATLSLTTKKTKKTDQRMRWGNREGCVDADREAHKLSVIILLETNARLLERPLNSSN